MRSLPRDDGGGIRFLTARETVEIDDPTGHYEVSVLSKSADQYGRAV